MYILSHVFKNEEELDAYHQKSLGRYHFNKHFINPPCIVFEIRDDHDTGVGTAQITKDQILQLLS